MVVILQLSLLSFPLFKCIAQILVHVHSLMQHLGYTPFLIVSTWYISRHHLQIYCTTENLLPDMSEWLVIDVMIVSFVLFQINSAVPKCMFLDVVTMKGILFIAMIWSSVLGLPIVFCRKQAFLSLEYCLTEHLFFTIVNSVFRTLFVMSEYYCPFLEVLFNTCWDPFPLCTTNPSLSFCCQKSLCTSSSHY